MKLFRLTFNFVAVPVSNIEFNEDGNNIIYKFNFTFWDKYSTMPPVKASLMARGQNRNLVLYVPYTIELQ